MGSDAREVSAWSDKVEMVVEGGADGNDQAPVGGGWRREGSWNNRRV